VKSNSPSTSPQAAPKSTRIVFAGITFANNQADVLPASRAALDSAYTLLANNPELNVEIQGYASKSRSAVQREDLAVDLSKRRAKSVMDYLVYRGIAKKRLSVAGYGTQRPIDAVNPYSEVNRRIEFLVK
jgi:outer membrane protein OmpA-like peptidoglycan-associated protein